MAIMKQPPSKEYQDNYDRVFRKDADGGNKPRMLNQIERADLRRDLKETVEIARKTKV